MTGVQTCALPIFKVASNDDDVLILSTDGKLYGMGEKYAKKTAKAKEIKNIGNVIDMTGKYALTVTGKVYELHANSLPAKITGYRDGNKGEIDIVKIAQGANHMLALDVRGRVWALGANSYGQLGNGSWTASATRPVELANFAGENHVIKDIAAGNQTSAALTDDGKLYTWGYNGNGQLGLGHWSYKNTPVSVEGLKPMTAISAGYNDIAAIQLNGTVWMSGDNGAGQLGDGTLITRNKFEVVGSSDVLICDEADPNTPLYGTLFMKRGETKTLKGAFDFFNVFEAVTTADKFSFGSNRNDLVSVDVDSGKITAAANKAGTAYVSVTEKTYTGKSAYLKVVVSS